MSEELGAQERNLHARRSFPTRTRFPVRIPHRSFAFWAKDWRRLLRPAVAVALALAFILAMLYGVRGCGPRPAAGDHGGAYIPSDTGGAPTTFSGRASGRVGESNFLDIPVMMTERVTQDTFDGPITGRLSPDGKSYLVSGTFLRGGRKYLGFRVYDLEGKQLWEHLFTGGNYRSSNAWYGPGGQVIAGVAVDYSQDGEVHVLDSGGRYLLNRSIDGWTQPVVSDDGSWVAFLNANRRIVQVFGPPNLSPAWSASTGQGATGLFIGNGPEFLLCEAGRARLFSSNGQVLWTVDIPGKSRWNVTCSPDRKYLAATTEDPDSTVYLYSVGDGSLVWSQFLVTGGNKCLTFSPDGSMLVVYDVGQHSAIYMMDAATGEIPWRYYLRGREGSTITIRQLQFSPSGQSMVADVVESTVEDDTYTYYHYLLRLTPDGRAQWVSPLGSGVDVDLNVPAGLALVVTNNPIDMHGNVSNSLTLVSFEGEGEGEGGAGGG